MTKVSASGHIGRCGRKGRSARRVEGECKIEGGRQRSDRAELVVDPLRGVVLQRAAESIIRTVSCK